MKGVIVWHFNDIKTIPPAGRKMNVNRAIFSQCGELDECWCNKNCKKGLCLKYLAELS